MKARSFTCVAVVSLLLVGGVGSSSAKTCQESLADNTYRCTSVSEIGSGDLCIQFDSTPSVSDQFDMILLPPQSGGSPFAHGCSCNNGGKSKEFMCVGATPLGSGTLQSVLRGKVNGNGEKIKDVRTWSNPVPSFPLPGVAGIAECVIDPSCTASGSSPTLTAE